MKVVPCSLCGYDSPGSRCAHCGHEPREPSLNRPLRGGWDGVLAGFSAVPKGLGYLARTRGIKRWLVPPFLLTSVLLFFLLWWVFRELNELLESFLPGEIELGGEWGWLASLSERWDWLKATWNGMVAAVEWTLNTAVTLLTSQPLRFLGWFLIGSLVVWYCFSIAYEMLAGPFLDEVQARLEAGWFGADPRGRLERPNDIPTERCVRLSLVSLLIAVALGALMLLLLAPPWWLLLLGTPLALVPAVLYDRRYGGWLRWVARVEARATWASLQASLLTAILIVLALPLYFVPGVGYFLFAGVCGFATAVGLMDIPFERRGWKLAQRFRFLSHNILPFLAFGMTSGILLSIPFFGAALMVPAASIGGLWLLCRLDKTHLRSTEGEEST